MKEEKKKKQEDIKEKEEQEQENKSNKKEKKVKEEDTNIEVAGGKTEIVKEEKEKTEKQEKEIKDEKNDKNNTEKEEQKETAKRGFFKNVWDSITKIEKYPEMAAQGFGRAISYLAKIVAILAIVMCLGIVYQTHNVVRDGINYLEKDFPEFSYNEGTLNVESEEPITIDGEKTVTGYTIIDTKTEDEQTINKYINIIQEAGNGIVVLKDKVILKNSAVTGTINYEYKQIFEQMGITQLTKQDVINYANSSQIFNLYFSIFLTIFVYSFVMYMVTTLLNAIFLSVFGWLTTIIAKIKIRFVAVFNMSVYALTLSVILNMIYIAINVFVDFNIEYFQVMYISVAAIYLVAAIFILKSEFIKKQAELIKIVEAQKIVKQELEKEKEEKEKEEKAKNKDTNKNDDNAKEEKKTKKEKKENKKDDNVGEEPEGSNA